VSRVVDCVGLCDDGSVNSLLTVGVWPAVSRVVDGVGLCDDGSVNSLLTVGVWPAVSRVVDGVGLCSDGSVNSLLTVGVWPAVSRVVDGVGFVYALTASSLWECGPLCRCFVFVLHPSPRFLSRLPRLRPVRCDLFSSAFALLILPHSVQAFVSALQGVLCRPQLAPLL
jgi:hypothetical protein